MRRSAMRLAAALCLLTGAIRAAEKKALVLNVSKGVMPNSGPEGTRISLAERQELAGVCLKVVFEKDIWFADTRGKDWSPFAAFKFDVLNPAQEPVNLNLTIKHKGTHNYDTRVDRRLVAKPGKNTCEVELADLANNDGTSPDLSWVNIWSLDGPKGATLYFGNLWLEGEAAAGAAAAPTPTPAKGIRITGTFDITITGLDGVKIAVAPKAAPKPAPPAPAAKKATLMAISKGKMPTDVWEAKLALVEEPQLGGVALKAAFTKDSWFADSNLRVKDWRSFACLKFAALNPGRNPASLDVTIKHKGSRDYDTRVDRHFALAPGKNELSIPLTGLSNNDGSLADLSVVNILTLSCGAGATVLFGDFTLE